MIIWMHNTFECWDIHLIVIQASLLLPANEVVGRYCFHKYLSFCSRGPLPMMHWDIGTPLPSPTHGAWVPTPSLLPWRSDLGTYPLVPATNICWWSLETWDPLPCYWHLVLITGDLFKLVHLRTYTHQYGHLVVATEVDGTHPTWMLIFFIIQTNTLKY